MSIARIVKEFKRLDDLKDTEIDAAGDGDVLVIMDLREDESLKNEGVACEIVKRIKKLRKKSCIEEVYFESLDMDVSVVQQVLYSQEQYIRDKIGSPLLRSTLMLSDVVMISDESFQLKESKLSFKISLARPALKFNEEVVLALYSGERVDIA